MMLDLITRLQAATGPAEDLDRAIWHATHPGETPFGWPVAIYPQYTCSIDAAVALVPEGLGRMSGRGRTRPDEPLFGCILYSRMGRGKEVAQAETDAGEAIAICIAALRARAGGGT